MALPIATAGNRGMAEVADAIIAMQRDIGTLHTAFSKGLEKICDSAAGIEKRLLDIDETLKKDVGARLDSLALDMTTTRVDMQALGLDVDHAHDRVCITLDEFRSGVSKAVQESREAVSGRLEGLSSAVINVNSRTKTGFLELGQGLDVNHDAFATKLDRVLESINLTVSKKIDNLSENINKSIADTRDDLEGRFDEIQEEVESSRRRIHEKLNNIHEALASIMNTTRDSVLRKIERATTLFSTM